MGLINGTITYRKYKLVEELPSDFKETLVREIPRHAFREIDPKINPELSLGWVNAMDYGDAKLSLEKVLIGKYVILGLRRDQKRVPAVMLKARLQEALKAAMQERRGRRMTREEMAGLKETVKESMLKEVSPQTAFYETVWNYETNEVFFSAQSTKVATEFNELFEETFKLPLIEVNLVQRTEAFIEEKGFEIELGDLESMSLAG